MRARLASVLCGALLLLLAGTSPAFASETNQARELSRVWATTPDAGHGKILYLMHCRSCHSSNGWGDGPRSIPTLAGQRERYLVEQLTQFAVGKRAGQSMHETMQRPDLDWPQAVRDLGAYLSGAPRSPAPEYGQLQDVSAGKRRFDSACKGCHGGDGEGTKSGIPAIGGQQYRYLVEQLGNFAYGHRDSADLRLLDSMGTLWPEDVTAIANYASHLTYLTADNPQ